MRGVVTIALALAICAACGPRQEPRKLSGKELMTPIEAAVGPLRVSAANPRYLETPAGKIVYLAGSYTWNNLQDWGATNPPPAFNFNGYVDFLVAHGHNFTRLLAWEQGSGVPWSGEQVWLAPLPYERTGPGTALDGQPKFDLTKWNEKYFDRLRGRVRQAERRGIYVSVMLFNGQATANAWKGHPFNAANNVNAIDGDANKNSEGEEVHTLANPAVTALQRAYIAKMVETLGDLGNVLWEVGNDPLPASREWQSAMATQIGEGRVLVDKAVFADTRDLADIGRHESRIWQAFLRGFNPVLLDPYRSTIENGVPVIREPAANALPQPDRASREWWPIRRSVGYTRWFASRIDLKAMTPRPELASTRYCLADPGRAYLIYLPPAEGVLTRVLGWWPRRVQLDLSNVSGTFATEWFDPATASFASGPQLAGGALRALPSPFGNRGAVLHVTALRSGSPAN
jgi:hypothetical protein